MVFSSDQAIVLRMEERNAILYCRKLKETPLPPKTQKMINKPWRGAGSPGRREGRKTFPGKASEAQGIPLCEEGEVMEKSAGLPSISEAKDWERIKLNGS